MRTRADVAFEAKTMADAFSSDGMVIGQVAHKLARMIHDLACATADGSLVARLRADVNKLTTERDEVARRVESAYPSRCAQCRDTGVLTGNNDWPCSCAAGDHALFNTPQGRMTGAQIKAGNR